MCSERPRGDAPRAHRPSRSIATRRRARLCAPSAALEEAHGVRRGHHGPGRSSTSLRELMRFHESVDRYEEWSRRRSSSTPTGTAPAPSRATSAPASWDLRREVRDPRLRRATASATSDDERVHLQPVTGSRKAYRLGAPIMDWRWSSTTRRRSARTAFSSPKGARGEAAPPELRGPALHGGLRAQTRWSSPRATCVSRAEQTEINEAAASGRRPGHLPRHHRRPEEAHPRALREIVNIGRDFAARTSPAIRS